MALTTVITKTNTHAYSSFEHTYIPNAFFGLDLYLLQIQIYSYKAHQQYRSHTIYRIINCMEKKPS